MIILMMILIINLINHNHTNALNEAADGSVCFNDCSGHGTCLDYSCTCISGYFGDDCRYSYADQERDIIPILGSGHFNLTRKNFTSNINKHSLIVVGFSSYTCHKCIMVEYEYHNLSKHLDTLNIPFARADSMKMTSISQDNNVNDLPAVVVFKKNKPINYKGVHTTSSILAFINKIKSKSTILLKTINEVHKFLYEFKGDNELSLSTVTVIGFFSEYEDVEEDDYDDYIQASKLFHHKEDVYFGRVIDPKVSRYFIDNKWIDRTPSLLLVGEDNSSRSINLDELYGDGMGIDNWILKNSVPLVAKMIPENFLMYEKLGLPMLLLFLDLEYESRSMNPGVIIGGKSGGILNEDLLQEFRIVAAEHGESISFVYLDGNLHKDKMRSLGLYGGKERLPSLAFNTKDGRQIPFSEKLPINKDTLLQFCADFLSGKLRSAADAEEAARKALLSVTPINMNNKAVRKERKKAPAVVTGVAEQFGDGNSGDGAVVAVTTKNFQELVLNEDQDVLLMLHAKECEPCSHLSVYYKRMAERFADLNISSLTITQMDVSNDAPPAELQLMNGELPIVVLLQAVSAQEGATGVLGKRPPWSYFSGVGKVQVLMKWVHENVAIPFSLPNLPHLTEEQKVMYKTQVREREVHLEEKRLKEQQALLDEEEEQLKFMNNSGGGGSDYGDGDEVDSREDDDDVNEDEVEVMVDFS